MQRFFLSFLILTFGFFSGCSVVDFIGAYFNTYYNASKLFTEAETEILKAPVRQTTRTERPFLAPFDIQPQTKAKFTTVIEKCSKLLQYHPESKLVDDALLMIGKSYYYQNEHQSAERKFKELLEAYPESDLALETRLLLANTYYRSNDKAAAATVARELFDHARSEKEEGIASGAALVLAHIESENKNLQTAIAYFKTAGELAESDGDQADAFRREAAHHEQLEQYADAAEAFRRSEQASNDHFKIAQARIGRARMLSKLEQHRQSIELLESLIENQNYREMFGDIDLEIGNVYRDEKDYASAEAQYRYVDTAYARTEASANSYYQRGLMYEHIFFNFDSARAAYDKGRGEVPQAEVTPLLAKRSDYLNRYFTLKKAIALNDSIKQFILNPDTTKSDTVTIEVTEHDTTVTDTTVGVALAKPESVAQAAPVIPPPPLDTVHARLAFNISELAGVFYTSMELADSAKYWYSLLMHEYPESPYIPRALYTLAQIERADSGYSRSYVDSLHREILKRLPESEFAAESRRYLGLPPLVKAPDTTEASYRRAETFVHDGDFVSALSSFESIVATDSVSPFAAKAQYTIGWIYENVKVNNDSSVAHYQRLVRRFPNSEYASVVQHKLAEYAMLRQRELQEQKATNDSLSVAPVQDATQPQTPDDNGPMKKLTVPVQPDTVIDGIRAKRPPPPSKSDDIPEQ
ncbi:MAG: tetratricopeptide repeat protein [Bacteroidetes bacterium]|nr:tetratricopeptide repeat protein [Bacteroidota bacterium]MCW5896264.1 tetratricopeptide repeat protein [Bacteroidota bacterium]